MLRAGESRAERCDRKKALKPAAKRELVAVLRTEHGLSERRACAAVGLQRSVYHYEPQPNADGPIVKLLLELAWQRPEKDLESCSSDGGAWATVGTTNGSIAFIVV